MRTRALVFVVFLLALPRPGLSAAISTELQQRLASLPEAAAVPVILRFADRVDLRAYRGRSDARNEIMALRARADVSQRRVLAHLRAHGLADAKSFWIDNLVAVKCSRAMLSELAKFSEIESIDFDEPVGFDGEQPVGGGGSFEWNISLVGADQAWSLGHDGTGIVVGSMDTGFDPAHPALAGKWRGGTNSWADMINGMLTPYDDHGHGSHTIGTMVGGDGPGPFDHDIGVAYGAKFISAKVLDATNSFSSASIVVAGAQWMLDPDGNPATNDFPAVINNSWFFFTQTYTGFHSTVDAWRAAGIIPVFCMGNSGPNSFTTRAPANYDNTLGIGAVTSADVIASFSSRGPSPAGPGFPADLRKPDLCAPGSLVTSSLPGASYAAWSGTSMATPHVTATIALILQAHPGLTFDQIRSILISTAVDRGGVGYDDFYGYGRLDALAAAASVLGVGDGGRTAPGPRLTTAPNPFTSRLRIDYAASRSGGAVEVFDLHGSRVWAANADASSGTLTWDGRRPGGQALPAGLYLVRYSDGERTAFQRVILLD